MLHEQGEGYFVKRRNIAGQPRASPLCPATSVRPNLHILSYQIIQFRTYFLAVPRQLNK